MVTLLRNEGELTGIDCVQHGPSTRPLILESLESPKDHLQLSPELEAAAARPASEREREREQEKEREREPESGVTRTCWKLGGNFLNASQRCQCLSESLALASACIRGGCVRVYVCAYDVHTRASVLVWQATSASDLSQIRLAKQAFCRATERRRPPAWVLRKPHTCDMYSQLAAIIQGAG